MFFKWSVNCVTVEIASPGDAFEQYGKVLAPAVAQTQAQNSLATLAADDGADHQYLGAQRREARRFILGDFAFELGDQVEQKTDQPEGGFGAIERLQTKTTSAEIFLELFDTVLDLGAAVIEAPGLHRIVTERGHQDMKGVAGHLEQFASACLGPFAQQLAHHYQSGAARSSHGPNNWFRPPPVRGRRAATLEFPPPPGAAVDSCARRSHRAAHAAPIPPEIRSGKSLNRRAPHRNENPPAPAPASPPGTP